MNLILNSFSNIGKVCDIEIIIDKPVEEKKRKKTTMTVIDKHDQYGNEGKQQTFVILDNTDPVTGKIIIKPTVNYFDHTGIKNK